MKVKFKKGKERDILECTRVDGSITWRKVHPGMIFHDMLHYIIEKQLRFDN